MYYSRDREHFDFFSKADFEDSLRQAISFYQLRAGDWLYYKFNAEEKPISLLVGTSI